MIITLSPDNQNLLLGYFYVYKCKYNNHNVKYYIVVINLFVHICTIKLKYIHLWCDKEINSIND